MMEVIIPKRLNITESKILERNMILDATEFPQRPLRCTISCMSPEKICEITESKAFWVDTSECEVTKALGDGRNIWAWTLRVSREDKTAPDHFHYFVPGVIKWGKF